MQLKIGLDDNNYITVAIQLQKADDNGPNHGPEIIAATITDTQLSDIGQAELLDIAAQTIGYFEANEASQRPAADWAADYREMCR